MALKVIISTGQGRLHLIESANQLKSGSTNIKIITGWIPSQKIPKTLINFIGKIIGRKNLDSSLKKRLPININREDIGTCAASEFFVNFLFLLTKIGLLNHDMAATVGWTFFGWQSKKYIKNAHIFHVRSGAGQGGAISYARSLGMKIIVDHSIAHPSEVFKQLRKANHDALEQKIWVSPDSRFWQMVLKDCQEADIIQVNSDYVKESFIDNGFSPEKIITIPLGVREDFIGKKQSYTLNKDMKLLFTGGFGLRKGAKIIINAIEILIKKKIRFQLDIIGSVINDCEIPYWFKEHEFIKFHGHIDQDLLRNHLINSDIYIFPSYSEGAAQSLKEAMAIGLPVIATRQSGAPIKHKENGYIIIDDSSIELANAIIFLSKNTELRSKLGKAASVTISSQHTWKIYSYKCRQLYKNLMENRGYSA